MPRHCLRSTRQSGSKRAAKRLAKVGGHRAAERRRHYAAAAFGSSELVRSSKTLGNDNVARVIVP